MADGSMRKATYPDHRGAAPASTAVATAILATSIEMELVGEVLGESKVKDLDVARVQRGGAHVGERFHQHAVVGLDVTMCDRLASQVGERVCNLPEHVPCFGLSVGATVAQLRSNASGGVRQITCPKGVGVRVRARACVCVCMCACVHACAGLRMCKALPESSSDVKELLEAGALGEFEENV